MSEAEAVQAERDLLRASAVGDATTSDTVVGPGKRESVHAISVTDRAPPGSPTLVALAGYSAGAGYFFRALDGLSRGFCTHAVDWLGTGLSGRPKFRAKTREEAEAFFLDALETWRADKGIERFVLMGHSLGGYLATKYALKHPDRVEHLVLVSPAGVSPAPQGWHEAVRARAPTLSRTVSWLWERGVTPGSVIRVLGPGGKNMVERYVQRRFALGVELTPEEVDPFERYCYQIVAARGSGEHALSHLLAPFAWPREPLEAQFANLNVPISFVYGERDWIDPNGGRRALEAYDRTAEEKQGDGRGRGAGGTSRQTGEASSQPAETYTGFAELGGDSRLLTVHRAGHYPFIDNPRGFLGAIQSALGASLPEEGRQALHAAVKAARRPPPGEAGLGSEFGNRARSGAERASQAAAAGSAAAGSAAAGTATAGTPAAGTPAAGTATQPSTAPVSAPGATPSSTGAPVQQGAEEGLSDEQRRVLHDGHVPAAEEPVQEALRRAEEM